MTDTLYQSIIRAILELLKGCENKEDIERAMKIIQAMLTVTNAAKD
jgi:hypothetical protein